jgi:plastocyanin
VSENQIKVGDTVSWTKTSGRGRTINMVSKAGTVTALDDQLATVKTSKHAKPVQVHLSRLRLAGQKSELTEFVEAVVEASRE